MRLHAPPLSRGHSAVLWTPEPPGLSVAVYPTGNVREAWNVGSGFTEEVGGVTSVIVVGPESVPMKAAGVFGEDTETELSSVRSRTSVPPVTAADARSTTTRRRVVAGLTTEMPTEKTTCPPESVSAATWVSPAVRVPLPAAPRTSRTTP